MKHSYEMQSRRAGNQGFTACRQSDGMQVPVCRPVLRSEAARDVELPLSQLQKAEKALTEMARCREQNATTA